MQTVWIFLVLSLTHGAWCYTGDLTFYYEWRGNYGSCGLDRAKYDQFYVAALSRSFMQLPAGITNPNKHPLCNADRCIEVTGNRGRVVLKISDTCWGCATNDVDVADTVFPMLDDPNRGRVKATWKFVNCQSNPPGRK